MQPVIPTLERNWAISNRIEELYTLWVSIAFTPQWQDSKKILG